MNRVSPLARAVQALCNEAAKPIAKAVIDSGELDKHKHEDGTWDGVGILAELSGLTREEVQAEWLKLKSAKQT